MNFMIHAGHPKPVDFINSSVIPIAGIGITTTLNSYYVNKVELVVDTEHQVCGGHLYCTVRAKNENSTI